MSNDNIQFSDGMSDVLAETLKVCTSINQTNRDTIRMLLDEVAKYPCEMWYLQERITMLELKLITARMAST
jgi:hypothetical protein